MATNLQQQMIDQLLSLFDDNRTASNHQNQCDISLSASKSAGKQDESSQQPKSTYPLHPIVKILEDNEESKKLVGKPIHFDEIEEIDQELKDTVIGYIHESQQALPYQNNIFYTVPQQIYYWCLLYVHDSFAKMVRDIYNDNIHTKTGCVRAFRKLLSSPNKPPIKQVIDSGVVPRFIQLCQDHNYSYLQYESLWTLLNIASGPAEAAAYIIRNDAHICFLQLVMSSPYYEIKDQAMYVLLSLSLALFVYLWYLTILCYLYLLNILKFKVGIG